MTAQQLFWLLVRRWYLMVVGAVLTLAGMYVVNHQQGVYWTQVSVVLLAPPEEYFPNKIQDPRYALAPMAGVLVDQWNQDNPPLLTASGDTTLFGEGRREGIQVRMPNQGSQWSPRFLTPNIDVQVVGSDPTTVQRQAVETSDELSRMLRQRQLNLGVDPRLFISTVRSPDVPTVAYVSGSRPRALLATGLAGAVLTSALVVAFDRTRRRRIAPGSSGSSAGSDDDSTGPSPTRPLITTGSGVS